VVREILSADFPFGGLRKIRWADFACAPRGASLTDVAQRVLNNHVDNPDAECAIVVTHPQSGKPLQLHPVNRRL